MLERVTVQLSDPQPAPQRWAGPPQAPGHRSAPEEAHRGTGASDEQPQVEHQR